MRSRIEQVLARGKAIIGRGLLRPGPPSTRVLALPLLLAATGVLLVVAGLVPAAADGLGPLAALAQVDSQETPLVTNEAPDQTQEPSPEDTPTDEPDAPDRTAEPAPSQTPEPPQTIEPTPGDTSEPEVETRPEPTAEATSVPETATEPATTEPIATERANASATAAALATALAARTPTPEVSRWSDDWPLGSIEFGTTESGPPAGPVQVTMAEWLRLALALVVVMLGAVFGGRLLYQLMQLAARRQAWDVDEALLLQIKPLLSWWLAAIGFQITVLWINFQNDPAQQLFTDLVFFAYLGVATLTAWRFVDRAIDLYADRIAAEGQAAHIEKLRPLMRRWARALILLVSALVGLGRLQAGFSVPALLVLFIILTVALAARDTIQDVVAGFLILLDQPFRIGDRVEVQGVDTCADVVSIGLRSSVLRTRHNVEVTVPNSTIGNNRVINYSYPDTRYRMQTHVGIAFGTNVEHARQVMIDAVRQADYVLRYEPVEALYLEIGDSAMIFRVRWWISFDRDWERAYDGVHTALHNALAEHGIDSPCPSQSLNVEVDDRTLAKVWQAWQGEGE